MRKRVLVVGGAGFIGSHTVDALLARGYETRILDNLAPQVHGELGDAAGPPYLDPEAELVRGDVRDRKAVKAALVGVDAVIHLAAAVGVGQSMYEIKAYTEINDLGTAILLEALAESPVERLVTASSMSIYGEGLAMRADGAFVEPAARSPARLAAGSFELEDAAGRPLQPVPTPETKSPSLSSVYALGKYVQERMTLIVAPAYGIDAVGLRLFNVFGPRQALSNPYTGVLAIFAARLMNGRPPMIFEDGRQRRDFVHVKDVARAFCLALEAPAAKGQVFNIGSGESRTVAEVAHAQARSLGRPELLPEITRRYRTGDIRHCFADIGAAQRVLGFAPEVGFEEGLEELALWLEGEIAQDRIAKDRVDEATAELQRRGLMA